MRLKLKSDELRLLLEVDPLELPKYVAPILNLANKTAGGTKPAVVGKVTDLIKVFGEGTLEDWEKWYREQYEDKLTTATVKIVAMLKNFRCAMDSITEEVIRKWVRDLVIVKTFIGLRIQEAILRKIAKELNVEYESASAEDESRNIDGWVGGVAVTIKPDSYKLKPELLEDLPEAIIYYGKDEGGVVNVVFDETKLRRI